MCKRILSLLLCLAIALSLVVSVYADETESEEVVVEPDLVITDVKEFLKFTQECRLDSYSRDLSVVLNADIDLSGTGFTGVPIFCGTFDGMGHTISGLELTGDGSAQGLFRYLTDTALVQDLQVEGTVQPGGTRSRVGGIAGNSTGVIRSSVNYGDVGYKHMGYNIGGIAGTQSGYITACENNGFVQGRKEVGGIVGQMEPATVIEYTEDTLQILQGQLNSMGSLVNRASSNAMSNAGGITSRLGALQDQTENAKQAVQALIPDRNNPQLPDQDTLLAAQNTLTDSFTGMNNSIRGIATAAQNTVSGLSRDLQAVSNQMGAMSNTINQAEENIGGTVTDVSDLDTAEDLTGKVEYSMNYGDVLGELNVGGIAGAMAVENDADLLEDLEKYGDESMNFDSEIRAVVLGCENRSVITGQKQNVGGITGWQSVGLVKLSTNTGKVDGEAANYVGGISGMSSGFIRACGVKAQILGHTRVGGIAGTATIVTDSLSMVELMGVSEQVGAILGQMEESLTEEENPIARNFYLCVGEEYGAIDGINYAGLAEDLGQGEFLVQENLANIFKSVTVEFIFEDGTVEKIQLAPGGRLNTDLIPEVPQKEGYSGVWAGLAQTDLTDVLFDMQFETEYTAYRVTIASSQETEDKKPLVFVEGSFSDQAEVTLEQAQTMPSLAEGEVLLQSLKISTNEPGHTIRLWVGEGNEAVKVLVNGVQTPCYVDGSYLVFAADGQNMEVCLVQPAPGLDWRILAAAGGAALLVLILVITSVKKRKKKAATPVE